MKLFTCNHLQYVVIANIVDRYMRIEQVMGPGQGIEPRQADLEAAVLP
jgi:hypothetical protein